MEYKACSDMGNFSPSPFYTKRSMISARSIFIRQHFRSVQREPRPFSQNILLRTHSQDGPKVLRVQCNAFRVDEAQVVCFLVWRMISLMWWGMCRRNSWHNQISSVWGQCMRMRGSGIEWMSVNMRRDFGITGFEKFDGKSYYCYQYLSNSNARRQYRHKTEEECPTLTTTGIHSRGGQSQATGNRVQNSSSIINTWDMISERRALR